MTRAEAARLVSVGAARWEGDALVYARPPRPLSCDVDRFGLVCDGLANVVAYGLVGRVRYRCDGCAWCMTTCATVRFMDEVKR